MSVEVKGTKIATRVLRNTHNFVSDPETHVEFGRDMPIVLQIVSLTELVNVIEYARSYRAAGCARKAEHKIGDRVPCQRSGERKRAAIVLLEESIETALADVKPCFDGVNAARQC